MSKQMQLIMENWRKIVKEDKGSPQKLQEFTKLKQIIKEEIQQVLTEMNFDEDTGAPLTADGAWMILDRAPNDREDAETLLTHLDKIKQLVAPSRFNDSDGTPLTPEAISKAYGVDISLYQKAQQPQAAQPQQASPQNARMSQMAQLVQTKMAQETDPARKAKWQQKLKAMLAMNNK